MMNQESLDQYYQRVLDVNFRRWTTSLELLCSRAADPDFTRHVSAVIPFIAARFGQPKENMQDSTVPEEDAIFQSRRNEFAELLVAFEMKLLMEREYPVARFINESAAEILLKHRAKSFFKNDDFNGILRIKAEVTRVLADYSTCKTLVKQLGEVIALKRVALKLKTEVGTLEKNEFDFQKLASEHLESFLSKENEFRSPAETPINPELVTTETKEANSKSEWEPTTPKAIAKTIVLRAWVEARMTSEGENFTNAIKSTAIRFGMSDRHVQRAAYYRYKGQLKWHVADEAAECFETLHNQFATNDKISKIFFSKVKLLIHKDLETEL